MTTRLFSTTLGPADAPTVLLVHGWGGDGREWSYHTEELAQRYRVIVPDLRGHGRSPVPATGNTPAHMADDLAALLGDTPVTAVGHSMGVQVVNLLAVHHPHLVHSVIALDPAHGATGTEVDGIPARLATYQSQGARAAAEFVAGAFSPQAPPGLRTAHIRTVLGTPDHVISQAYAGMYVGPDAIGVRPLTEAFLRLRTQPALTVWTSAEAATWEEGTRSSRVEHWPGVGHYVHEEQPERTVRLIADWMSAGSNPGSP
ncbi:MULTISPECIES: alpha/beta fold hydrolase [unclassified Streptomyces]|uniref:alpha/beta fold hydrolase n=1 Tax=unclassified Streptomyces TaxID=2593676 RepID=UPI000DD7604C|nr:MULTISPECIES: alpha/beta hydrolase [unclassified Streptomyces]QZZ25441.1 alpha/beta hydrolase [Streptomyces sp. ST1015]